MTLRNQTKSVKIGKLKMGGNQHVYIQSMCNIKTSKVEAVNAQIAKLFASGCELIRVSVMDQADAAALPQIVAKSPIPVVADIHFDYRLAIASLESGVSKVRVNPGNLGDLKNFEAVIKAAKQHHAAIRIGINSGSLDKKLLSKNNYNITKTMLDSAKSYIKVAEKLKFYNLVLSFKSSDLLTTIAVNEAAAKLFKYPLHLGVTEAGTQETSLIRSAAALGVLLKEGLGNTIRISITGDPLLEIQAAKELLASLNLRKDVPHLISCPTCGRTEIDLVKIVNQVKPYIDTLKKPLTVAIMGCIVNGPGEASHADIGIAGGKKEVLLFKKGKIIGKYPSKDAARILIEEMQKM